MSPTGRLEAAVQIAPSTSEGNFTITGILNAELVFWFYFVAVAYYLSLAPVPLFSSIFAILFVLSASESKHPARMESKCWRWSGHWGWDWRLRSRHRSGRWRRIGCGRRRRIWCRRGCRIWCGRCRGQRGGARRISCEDRLVPELKCGCYSHRPGVAPGFPHGCGCYSHREIKRTFFPVGHITFVRLHPCAIVGFH